MSTIRSEVQSLVSGLSYQENVLNRVYIAARDGELPREFQAIADGIQYSLVTGRLPGKADIAVRHLSTRSLAKVLCDLYESGVALSGDVPRALIVRFA